MGPSSIQVPSLIGDGPSARGRQSCGWRRLVGFLWPGGRFWESPNGHTYLWFRRCTHTPMGARSGAVGGCFGLIMCGAESESRRRRFWSAGRRPIPRADRGEPRRPGPGARSASRGGGLRRTTDASTKSPRSRRSPCIASVHRSAPIREDARGEVRVSCRKVIAKDLVRRRAEVHPLVSLSPKQRALVGRRANGS